MLSSLLRPKRARPQRKRPRRTDASDISPFGTGRVNDDSYFPRPPNPQQSSSSSEDGVDADESSAEDEEGELDEDGPDEVTPLLPIFSAAHLDALPVYGLTHSIRLLIVPRCETTLTWDQLRSPQISQFLVKPIQQQIRDKHFSRATLYALIANCLQFQKEGQNYPGNIGVCKTRGLLSELLAIRLLKEFSTRELIDCLAYDFDPLNGINAPLTSQAATRLHTVTTRESVQRSGNARTSTLEVAIRAQAKHFLAHPLVVQHLEAVWAGNIVFHSAADSLHRYPEKPPLNTQRHYGATHSPNEQVTRGRRKSLRYHGEIIRRSVTLYNPGEASLFKLSRLRVPRYRQLFSTVSYAIMLGFFIAILSERSLDITTIEVIFWFWSAGFMLDEIVGFSEQGFGLYIISVWNAFDLGTLLLFFIYYVLRLYGIIIAENHKHKIADMAYDVLASTAILLFPRLFSFLDHYRYFSQLLIAFRMMAQDLAAILILIGISCSGFFVAFSLSFGDNDFGGPSGVIYGLFQIVMGFTPAAWAVWPQYNMLGKALLTIFLVICHFLVVTILITVLTNSFMAIVQNANEEHQFLFAVNTISMVKSDALFSYIAPSNIMGWICTPLRYVIPFRQFVKLNRTVIKITHFPILFIIFAYERLFLGHYAYEPLELVEQVGRKKSRLPAFALAGGNQDVFSPGARVREPSIRTFRKDQALDEVFRQPFTGDSTVRKPQPSVERQSNVVDRWMTGVGDDGGASPPMEQSRSILEQLETRRPPMRRAMTNQESLKPRGFSAASRSILSDPEELRPRSTRRRPVPISEESEDESQLVTPAGPVTTHDPQATDADADDEYITNAGEEESGQRSNSTQREDSDKENEQSTCEEVISTPTGAKPQTTPFSSSVASTSRQRPQTPKQGSTGTAPQFPGISARTHDRHSSTNTIVFKPAIERYGSSSPSPRRSSKTGLSYPRSGAGTPKEPQPTRFAPRRTPTIAVPRPRPNMPSRDVYKSAPNVARFLDLASQTNRRVPSFDAIALDLASDIGDNRNVMHLLNDDTNYMGPMAPMAGSFQTQFDFAARARAAARQKKNSAEESTMMGRMVLARMNTLEEGFKDILKEVKDWRNASSRGTSANEEVSSSVAGRRLARRLERKKAADVQQMEERRLGKQQLLQEGDENVEPQRPGSEGIGVASAGRGLGPSPLGRVDSSRSSV